MKALKESLLGNAGLGKKEMIENWLNRYNIKNYRINSDFTIDVNGNVDIHDGTIKEFPTYIKFNEIKGYFNCSYNKLESLAGFPEIVGNHLNVANNNLKSLKGCTKKVYGGFVCSNNYLKTLENGPEYIKGSYVCNNNLLTSLKGCPEEINERFDCSYNFIKTFKDGPKIVKASFFCQHNTPRATREDILKYCKTKEHFLYV